MARITARFETHYGTAQIVMEEENKVTIHLHNNWTVHRVEYRGCAVLTCRDGDRGAWQKDFSNTYIRRTDGKDINYRTETYGKMMNAIHDGFMNLLREKTRPRTGPPVPNLQRTQKTGTSRGPSPGRIGEGKARRESLRRPNDKDLEAFVDTDAFKKRDQEETLNLTPNNGE